MNGIKIIQDVIGHKMQHDKIKLQYRISLFKKEDFLKNVGAGQTSYVACSMRQLVCFKELKSHLKVKKLL